MLDSPNRPKGAQRRLARKRSNSQSQPTKATHSPTNQRDRRVVRAEGRPPQPRRVVGPDETRMQRQPNGQGEPRTASARPPRRLPPNPSQASSSRLMRDSQRPGQAPDPHALLERRRLDRLPPTQASRQRQKDRRFEPHRVAKPAPAKTSPLVYLVRLLIVGIGVGAIVGTTLSIWNPSMRMPSGASQATAPSQSSEQPNRSQVGSSAGVPASISGVRMGREMTELVTKVTPMVSGLTDLVPGVFLMDLDNGNFFSFNGTNTFSSASMVKLPILVAFFQDVDMGKVKLDEMLVIQQADLAEGSGDMQYAGTGTQYTALETATNMIITSDNTATNMIIRRLGGIEVLNQRFRQWGMQQTLMRKLLPDLEGTNTTSPKELVSVLALLNEGKLISMKSRDRVFDIMRRTVTDTLLPSVISPGSTVAHKTGDIGSMVGDVGVVDLPSGRRYAIAAMVKRPHNDGRAQDLVRQIAAVAYEQFGGQPVLAPSPIAPSPQVNPQQPVAPGAAPGVPLAPGQQQPMAPAYPTAPPAATNPMPMAPAAPAPIEAPAPVEPAAVESTEPTDLEESIPDATDPNAVDNLPDEQASDQPQDISLLPDWGGGR